ncbi:hypothetical protein GCM10011509_27310 [Ornithinimicrobium pekingense]|uniref:CMP/dCMP-type deaminase domain-containing protein n=1 Tax=Ornithinimicrobium pekingense TaxID=384677 RepID=A0ABQ2FBF1_9MICO|nr:hypothetical protein GCM10011509_27310 [Ornithinimicrobium pekingense]
MNDPLVVSVQVPAPPERVWRAWTSAGAWSRWWWPHCLDTGYVVDARPGGFYRAWSAGPGVGVHGTFTEVEEPRRLGMTWFWEGEVVDPPREHVVVELAPEGASTLVTVTHEVATQEAADDYREGWTFVLGNLAAYLGGDGGGGEVTEEDLVHLRRCVALAAQAVEAGDEPFGSVLVGGGGEVLHEDHNHVAGGDRTQHPELAIARWAAEHLSPDERAAATVYTSGEHCPMCAAAHGWVGLGRIVYATSSAQLGDWLRELGAPAGPVAPLPITAVVPGVVADGPVPELADEVRALHARLHRKG